MPAVKLGEFIYLYRQAFRQMLRPVLWLPLLILSLAAVGLALSHYHIFSPVFGPILKFWLGWLYPEQKEAFFHYPQHFLYYPVVLYDSMRILSLVLEGFFLGIFSALLIALYREEKLRLGGAFRLAAGRYFQMTGIWAIMLMGQYVISLYFYDFVQIVLGYSLHTAPRRQFGAFLGLHTVIALSFMPFLYMLPSLVADRKPFWMALRRAWLLMVTHPFVTLGLVGIPYAFSALFGIPLSFSNQVVTILYPESILYMTIVAIGAGLLANFVMMATAVKFFMDQNADR